MQPALSTRFSDAGAIWLKLAVLYLIIGVAIHFWLANISLPVMGVSLSLILFGHTFVVPALIVSEVLAAAGVLVFAANLFLNLGSRRR